MRRLLTALTFFLAAAPALAAVEPTPSEQAVATGPRDLRLRAEEHLKADRRAEGLALMKAAARGGDNLALIKLEQIRLSKVADAPSLSDMVEIEIARAEDGDAVAAWRLAQRYETGDGVKASSKDMVRWLQVAASKTVEEFPKAADAAYRLCEAYGRGAGVPVDEAAAQSWCARAAGGGHPGAVMVIARLRGVDG